MRLAGALVCLTALVVAGACRPPSEPVPPPRAPLVPMTDEPGPTAGAANAARPAPAGPTTLDIGDDLDRDDLCPNRGEDEDGHRDGDGCPDADNDRDGIDDTADRCPDVPAGDDPDNDGCPNETP